MNTLLKTAVITLALGAAAPAIAETQAQPHPQAQAGTDVTGWWRADIIYGDETEPIYFHFTTATDGKRLMRMTQPSLRVQDAPASAYAVEGGTLHLVNMKLDFTISADGQAIDGVLPANYVSRDPTPLHFTRSDPAPPLAEIPASPVAAPAPKWTASVGAAVWGGLERDGARAIFVADVSGHVTALSQSNGARLWRTDLGAQIRSAPTLRGGVLYVASDAAINALDARTGRRLWRAPFGPERGARLASANPNYRFDEYSSGVAVDGRLAVAGSRDGCVHAVRVRDGSQAWRTCTTDIITGTPAMTSDAVYFSSFDHFAYALSRADGKVLWRYDILEPAPHGPAIAGPNVLFGSRTFDITALDARSGKRAWFRRIWYSWVDSPQTVAEGRVYTGSSDALGVFAFDEATGRRIWKSPLPGWTWGGVALGAHSLYAGVVGGPYAIPRAGGLAAIRRTDGALRWRLDPSKPDPLVQYGFASRPVVVGSRVFAADLKGTVSAIDDTGG